MRILYLEDTEDELKEIAGLLRISFPGVDLETATTGKEAREKLDRARQTGKRFDVAVLDLKVRADINMPEELDLGLCDYAKDLFPEIVIMHYTGYADMDAVRAHGEPYMGYHKIVRKIPDGPSALVEAIRQGYGDKLLDRTRVLLRAGSKRSAAGLVAMRCGTLEMNALIQDIANDFGLLDSQRQAEIRNYVTVEEEKVEGPFRVTLGPEHR
jgi:DNA-binding NtrC family response regulator